MAALLTGQTIHRLGQTANLWSFLPPNLSCYTDILSAAGYHVGSMGKGWGPGSLEGSNRIDNPAGKSYRDFEAFQSACGKRPPEELYDVTKDPHNLNNLAANPRYAETMSRLRAELEQWMKDSQDPRVDSKDDEFDRYPYVNGRGGKKK